MVTQADDEDTPPALDSIFDDFRTLILDPSTTVDEANKLRTASYYEKARHAHSTEVVPGVTPHSRLVQLRKGAVDKAMALWNEGTKSHRTVIAMCDKLTSELLVEARTKILGPLRYSTDIATEGAWIPEVEIIPEKDMHITVAKPWGRHIVKEGNHELSRELAERFHQALLLDFHHPFQVELDRIILLGGNNLVALWRCVGERTTEDGSIIYDRHGDSVDPMTRLREEIVRCYTTESECGRLQPLTHASYNKRGMDVEAAGTSGSSQSKKPQPPRSLRHTIITNTPGFDTEKGKADGFIHTTLCRLSLDCLSSDNVDLSKIHRLCREASAALCGHRMIISKYRFLESKGEGARNPCVNPIYDESFDAPIDVDGADSVGGLATFASVGAQNAARARVGRHLAASTLIG